MNLDAFPIFQRLVSTQGPRTWDRPLSASQLTSLDSTLAAWGRAVEDGGIDNPRFVEGKDILNRALERAWAAVPRDDEALDQLPDAQRDALERVPNPNLSNLAGRLKRVQKTPDTPTRAALMALLEELLPVAEAYGFLKANTRKRQVKTEAEREAERLTPPPSSSAAVAMVREVLTEAIGRAYQGLVDRYTQANREAIQTFVLAQEKALVDPARKGRPYGPSEHWSRPNARGRMEVVDPAGVAFLTNVLAYEPRRSDGAAYQATDDTWRKSDAEAEKAAQFVRDQFLYKNLAKLTPVLEAKGDAVFEAIREVGRFELAKLEGEFEVRFTDGASFRLRNAVVFVVNQYGTSFHRFPTTFHDVILPGGAAMPSPSEERMHTVFAQAAAAPPRKPRM